MPPEVQVIRDPVARLLAVAFLLCLVTACGRVKEEKWAEKSAKTSCKFAKRCDTSNFWFQYDGLDACIDDTVSVSEGLYDGCSYDKKEAKRCIKALKWGCKKIGEEYNELLSRCNNVWGCTAADTGDTGTSSPTP